MVEDALILLQIIRIVAICFGVVCVVCMLVIGYDLVRDEWKLYLQWKVVNTRESRRVNVRRHRATRADRIRMRKEDIRKQKENEAWEQQFFLRINASVILPDDPFTPEYIKSRPFLHQHLVKKDEVYA